MSDSIQDTLNSLKLHPRLCHLIKWNDFNGYGFNLHAEKGKAGQFIGKVDDGSPAEAAFLHQGDRIIEVNGVNIGNENHQQVVQRIKAGGDETKLLVVDTETDIHFKNQKVVVRGEMPEMVYCKTPNERGFATPIMNFNQISETKQNEETGETTSQEIAETATSSTFITNGLSEDLPAPPPELIENGLETDTEKVAVSEAASKVNYVIEPKTFETDAIYDVPDAVPVIAGGAALERIDSGSVKSASEKSESDKHETDSVKAESVKSESDKHERDSIKADSEKCESENAGSVNSDSIKAVADTSIIEDAEPAKVSTVLKKVSLSDLEVPPSLPETIPQVRDVDVSDPINYVNVSVEQMREKILAKKRTNKYSEMNLKEKYDMLNKL